MASEIIRFEFNRECLVMAQRKSGKKEITAKKLKRYLG
jgi:hypothetical protein